MAFKGMFWLTTMQQNHHAHNLSLTTKTPLKYKYTAAAQYIKEF